MKESHGRIRILMADDHPMFRQGLRALLESNDDFEIVGEATNGSETVLMTQQHLPDVLLLDVSMLASVALVLSVVVTFLTYRLLRQRLQPPDEMTTIVVATQRVALGSRLTVQDRRLRP